MRLMPTASPTVIRRLLPAASSRQSPRLGGGRRRAGETDPLPDGVEFQRQESGPVPLPDRDRHQPSRRDPCRRLLQRPRPEVLSRREAPGRPPGAADSRRNRDRAVWRDLPHSLRGEEARGATRRSDLGPDDPSGKLLRQWGKTSKADGEFDTARAGSRLAADGRDVCRRPDQPSRTGVRRPRQVPAQVGRVREQAGPVRRKGLDRVARGRAAIRRARCRRKCLHHRGSECRVQKGTSEGKQLLAWGDDSDKPGGFGGGWMGGTLKGPVAICADGGTLWVRIRVNGRVQQFSPDGTFLRGLTDEPGTGPGQFMAPARCGPGS